MYSTTCEPEHQQNQPIKRARLVGPEPSTPDENTTHNMVSMVSQVLHWLPRHASLAQTILASTLLRFRAPQPPPRCISVEYPGSGILFGTLRINIPSNLGQASQASQTSQTSNQRNCQSCQHDFVRELQGMLAAKLNVDPAAVELFAGHDYTMALSDHTTQYSNQLVVDDALAKLLVENLLVFIVHPEWAAQIKNSLNSNLACWSVADLPVMMPHRTCQVLSHKCMTCRVRLASRSQPATCLPEQIYAFDVCKLYLQGRYCTVRQDQFVLAKPRSNLIAMRVESNGFKHIDWSVLSSVAHLECYGANDLCWPATQCFASISAQQTKNIRLDQLCGYASLTHLQLYDCWLDASIPPEISSLANLNLLCIRKCGLKGSVPGQLDQLTKLLEIDLSHNQLGGMLPCLDSLVNLEVINLERNKQFDNIFQTDKLVKLKVCKVDVSIHLRGFLNESSKCMLPCRSIVPENMCGIQMLGAFDKVGTCQLARFAQTPGW